MCRSQPKQGVTGDIGPVESLSDLLSNEEEILSDEDMIDDNDGLGRNNANEEVKAQADIQAIEKIQKDWPQIPDQLLFDLGALIHSVKEKMKKDGFDYVLFVDAKEVSLELAKALSVQEICLAMEKALESLKKIEQVFENVQGVGLVISDVKAKGFIQNDAHEKKFRENPELLKTEMTKTSYLTFVALAMAGNYIEYPPVKR